MTELFIQLLKKLIDQANKLINGKGIRIVAELLGFRIRIPNGI